MFLVYSVETGGWLTDGSGHYQTTDPKYAWKFSAEGAMLLLLDTYHNLDEELGVSSMMPRRVAVHFRDGYPKVIGLFSPHPGTEIAIHRRIRRSLEENGYSTSDEKLASFREMMHET